MKKVAGTLKLDQAQFRELEAFAKFGSDLDAATKRTIDRGRRNTEILKQAQYSPVSVEEQVAVIYVSTKGFLDTLPEEKVKDFEKEFLSTLKSQHAETLGLLKDKRKFEKAYPILAQVASDLVSQF